MPYPEKSELECMVLKGKMINTIWDLEKQHYDRAYQNEAKRKFKKYMWDNVPIALYSEILKDVYSRCSWKMLNAWEKYKNGK